jgi:hypothetical protein
MTSGAPALTKLRTFVANPGRITDPPAEGQSLDDLGPRDKFKKRALGPKLCHRHQRVRGRRFSILAS